jgi:hypothetical protein
VIYAHFSPQCASSRFQSNFLKFIRISQHWQLHSVYSPAVRKKRAPDFSTTSLVKQDKVEPAQEVGFSEIWLIIAAIIHFGYALSATVLCSVHVEV